MRDGSLIWMRAEVTNGHYDNGYGDNDNDDDHDDDDDDDDDEGWLVAIDGGRGYQWSLWW